MELRTQMLTNVLVLVALALPLQAGANAVFLDIPGIAGEASPPGFANIIGLDSASFNTPTLDVVKFVDKSSPGLALALIAGKVFPQIKLYDFNTLLAVPTTLIDTVTFSTVIVASETSLGGLQPKEEIKFNFATFTTTTPVPLPTSFGLLLSGLGGLSFLHRRARFVW